VSEVRYHIRSDADLPLPMQIELTYEQAFEMVCDWNDTHPVEKMAWLEQIDGDESRRS